MPPERHTRLAPRKTMSLAATTPAVTGAARPDFSSRIVALAASMASLCLIVPLLIFAARIIKSSPVLDALFFQRLPILAILFFSAVGVARLRPSQGPRRKVASRPRRNVERTTGGPGRERALDGTLLDHHSAVRPYALSRACADQVAGKPLPGLRALQEFHLARMLLRPRDRLCAGAPETALASDDAPSAGADHIPVDLASLREPGRCLLLRAGEGGNFRLRPAQHAAGMGLCGTEHTGLSSPDRHLHPQCSHHGAGGAILRPRHAARQHARRIRLQSPGQHRRSGPAVSAELAVDRPGDLVRGRRRPPSRLPARLL